MNTTLRIDGTTLTVRPIEPDDADRLARMFERLSPRSVYLRFFSPLTRLSRSTLLELVDVDHCSNDALVALDGDEIVAVARYNEFGQQPPDGGREAEIALTVEDAWQHRGVGRRLGRALGVLAARRGYAAFVATILPENREALGLLHEMSPDANVRFSGGDYHARLPLTTPSGRTALPAP